MLSQFIEQLKEDSDKYIEKYLNSLDSIYDFDIHYNNDYILEHIMETDNIELMKIILDNDMLGNKVSYNDIFLWIVHNNHHELINLILLYDITNIKDGLEYSLEMHHNEISRSILQYE